MRVGNTPKRFAPDNVASLHLFMAWLWPKRCVRYEKGTCIWHHAQLCKGDYLLALRGEGPFALDNVALEGFTGHEEAFPGAT
jgi:hypothetical protein